eukprot:gene4853-9672_t
MSMDKDGHFDLVDRSENDSGDGWSLYYSDEGYPYYYNALSGESVWAQVESGSYNTDYNNYEVYEHDVPQGLSYSQSEVDPNEDSSQDLSDHTSDDESPDSEASSGEEDILLEAEFQTFLTTPDGAAALETQKKRVERIFSKRNAPTSTWSEVLPSLPSLLSIWTNTTDSKKNDHETDFNNISISNVETVRSASRRQRKDVNNNNRKGSTASDNKLHIEHKSRHHHSEYSDDDEDPVEKDQFTRWMDEKGPNRTKRMEIAFRRRDEKDSGSEEEFSPEEEEKIQIQIESSSSSGSSVDSDDSDVKLIEEADVPPWIAEISSPPLYFRITSSFLALPWTPLSSVWTAISTASLTVSQTVSRLFAVRGWSGVVDSALRRLVDSSESKIEEKVSA